MSLRRGTIPRLPVPDAIKGREPGTWAYDTIVRRLPEIGLRVLSNAKLSDGATHRVTALVNELPHGSIRPLHDVEAPDTRAWKRYIAPYTGMNWLEVPWFFAETYFYRRVIEAVDYFRAAVGDQPDPFASTKMEGLTAGLEAVNALGRRSEAAVTDQTPVLALEWLFYASLWGNQADLSLWQAGEGPAGGSGGEHLIVDQTGPALRSLDNREAGSRVDMILDNAGFELVSDLLLADSLIQSGAARAVHLHLKAHPTFVSDATRRDLYLTLRYLKTAGEPPIAGVAERLEGNIAAGTIGLRSDFYWTSPLSGWEMTPEVREDLSGSDLVIVKGDANYRRLLGDRHWPFETPFEDIMSYFPAPLLALRTLKGEIAAGISRERAAALGRTDPDWLVNGRWGVMQFVP